MRYKVNKQYLRGPEISCAEFDDLNDAELFIADKCEEDRSLNVKVLYRLYDQMQLVKEFRSEDTTGVTGKTSESSSSGQGKGQSASFRPTPLNMSPRPPGTPPKWLIDDEEDSDSK